METVRLLRVYYTQIYQNMYTYYSYNLSTDIAILYY